MNGALHKTTATYKLLSPSAILTADATPGAPVGDAVRVASGAAHRAAPLKAIDEYRILSAHEITAEKLIRSDDPYLEGHYPDFTIYPVIFVIESVTQTAHALVEQTWESRIEIELASIRSVRFTAPLLVGDTLRIHCLCTYLEDNLLTVKADCRNERDERTARMTLEFRLVRADADE